MANVGAEGEVFSHVSTQRRHFSNGSRSIYTGGGYTEMAGNLRYRMTQAHQSKKHKYPTRFHDLMPAATRAEFH